MKPNILLVDDEQALRFGFSRYLTKTGNTVKDVGTIAEGKEALAAEKFDVILLDLKLPDGNGIDWLPSIRSSYPDMAIVVITGHGDIPLAVDAMRRGADNFLTKPVNMSELEVFLKKCLELESLRREQSARLRLAKKKEDFFGTSKNMKSVIDLAAVASENDSPVVLLGETGVGKGVMARWIHDHSSRSALPYVELNCSMLKGDLLASELFGHAKGAYTSAVQDREGLIELAHGGTLFLDEIGDMDISVQTQLLKVIEEKQFRRLGETKIRRSDFRMICATNRDLDEHVKAGKFRKDLFFRIYVFPIMIPPLRERMEDTAELVKHILETQCNYKLAIPSETMRMLLSYSWPGNIRELRNVLERAVLLARGNELRPEHFPGLNGNETPATVQITDAPAMEELQIQETIQKCGGDVNKAAELLGISRATLYRRLKKVRDTITN